MKVAITSLISIVGKDGREWSKVSYLKENGEVGFALFPKGKFDVSGLVSIPLDSIQFEDEITFGERGYIESIS